MAVLTTGCIYLGPRSYEEVVASRLNHDGTVVEQIRSVHTQQHWMMPIAPDGPELNTTLNDGTWKYYLVDAKGNRQQLPFLKRHDYNGFLLFTPILNTNLWSGVDDAGMGMSDHHNVRLFCFTVKGIVSEKTFDVPDYTEFHFDSERHLFTYTNKTKTLSYDPLGNTGLH